jgi:4-hydroxybenzoyl-CoA reductase subunit alpha
VDRVRFLGEEVAAVAAVDADAALEALDLIRVIKPHVGGKSDGLSAVEFCAALLARHAHQPVKIACSRDEEFMAARRKHPIQIIMKTGVKKDGTLVARKCRAELDGGAYCSLGPLTTVLVGTFQTLPFKFEHFQYDGYRIYTNKPPCGAMRGHGGPQVHFAQDVQLDMYDCRRFGTGPA